MVEQPTKNIRSRDWVFTINNPTPLDLNQLVKLSEHTSYIIFTPEVGDNGTHHFQGFCQFENARAFSTMKNYLPRAHLEKRRGKAQEADEYCKKLETKVQIEGYNFPFVLGTLKETATTSLVEVKSLLDTGMSPAEIVDIHPSMLLQTGAMKRYQTYKIALKATGIIRPLIVVWLSGETGSGKSYRAFVDYPDAYRITDRKNPWDLYNQEDVVIFDDWTHSDYHISEMLNWLDIYPTQLRARYSSSFANFTLVVITTNLELKDSYPNALKRHRDAFFRRIHVRAKIDHQYNLVSKISGKYEYYQDIPDLIAGFLISSKGSKASITFRPPCVNGVKDTKTILDVVCEANSDTSGICVKSAEPKSSDKNVA